MADRSNERPEPRAEELIVEIYRQFREQVDSGLRPTRVIVTPDHYELLQSYRARLGEMPGDQPDYLERYAVFGLEFHVGSADAPRVV